MNKLTIATVDIDGIKVLNSNSIIDDRGYFGRLFCQKELQQITNSKNIVQINQSITNNSGVIRGMHYQKKPALEGKFVTCLKGKIFDVAIDIRKDSKSLFNYHAEILSEENKKILYIPEGFAHGFQTIKSNCEVLYFHTEYYSQENESGINSMDPSIGINWPNNVSFRSERDLTFPFLDSSFKGIEI
jgi:dTDP-4-dehydrorhamnose 3,5-epimerase